MTALAIHWPGSLPANLKPLMCAMTHRFMADHIKNKSHELDWP